MIDINLIRNEKTRMVVIKSEKNRFRGAERVERVAELDRQRMEKQHELETANMNINRVKREIQDLKKRAVEDDDKTYQEMKAALQAFKRDASVLANEVRTLEQNMYRELGAIGNVLDESVVVSNNEADNKLIREYNSSRKANAALSYSRIFEEMQGVDLKRGAKLMGHRGYVLVEELALLKEALVAYAVDFARKRGYKLIQAPVLMKKAEMAKTAQLADFDEQLYKVEDDMYLIATSEQPLSVMHSGERFAPGDLPLKYVGQSLCFRREAGAHGKDNQGIFRVHQFDKIEQFVICSPSSSKDFFEEMIRTAEEFYRSLDISYRVVSIVSGEMNDAAAIKYDLEAYFPETNRYRELVSCSNCTDYQSRSAEIRYGHAKIHGKKEYVHMLNATLVAAQRTLCCIVENYQDAKGVVVPEVLRPYYKGSFIPFKGTHA